MPVTLVMLEAIRDFYYKTGKMIGMKPAVEFPNQNWPALPGDGKRNVGR
jgi:hypothetical protein